MLNLKQKVVLVTGASGGIGAACARAIVRAGGRVVLHDIKAEGRASQLAGELGGASCHLAAADLSNPNSVPTLWCQAKAWQGRIDVLVNNAGIYEPADVDGDFSAWERSWQRTLTINLLAPAHLCREAIRSFRGSGGGIIINIASRASRHLRLRPVSCALT
jgi:NAD(P)-dependent dehydrogenase (short-subunit alcohol dehydrogenase family)